jgi:tetratricopeptide (TPR) repeat protein
MFQQQNSHEMGTGKAVSIKKDLRQLYYELGWALLERNNYQNAIEHLSEALAAEGNDPADWQIHYYLGTSYASLSYRVLAAEHLLRAINGSPHPPAEWFKETASIIDRSTAVLKKDWLMNEFRKSLEEKKLDTAAQDHCQMLLAQIAIHLDDGELADTMLNRVAESNTQVIMYRGEAELLLGNTPGAIQNFEAARAAFAKNGDEINAEAAKICLARAEAETGNYAAAFRLTSDLKNIPPNHLHHVRLIDGYFFLNSGKSGDVQNCISQLRRPENRPDEANLLESRLLLSQKEYVRAAEVTNYAAAQTAQPWLRQEFNYLRSRALLESNTDVDGGISILKQLQKENAPLAYFKDRDRCAVLDGNGNYSFFLAVFASEILADQAEALIAMSKAASGGVTGGDSKLTEAIVLERMLQCQELTRATPGDLAETSYRIGIHHYNTSQYNEAVNWLRKSLGTKAMMKTRWYLIDSLFLDSGISEPPYVDQSKITSADSLWQESILMEHPDASFPWAYLLRARIMDSKSKLPGMEIYDCYREGWAFAEMATLLQPDRYLAWSFVGKFQRLLSFYANARQSLEKGMQLNAEDHYLIEDMAAVYLDTGQFDKAEPLLRDLKSRTNDAFYDGWLAFSYYNQHRLDEAIPLFKARIDRDANDFWARQFLMWCYWFKDQPKEAEAQAQWIWDHQNAAAPDQLDIIAGSAVILGKTDEAAQLYSRLTQRADYVASGKYGLLLCNLISGNLKDITPGSIDQLAEAGFDARQFITTIFEINNISARSVKENWKHGPELQQLIHDEKSGLIMQMKNHISKLESRVESPHEELSRQMKSDQYNGEGSWGWIACQAAAARLLMQENRINEAKDIYAKLLPYREKFHPLKSEIDWIVENFVKSFPAPTGSAAGQK